MREQTAWFIVAAPLLVLLIDALVWWRFGDESTITSVVRGWARESPWPEFLFLLTVVVLYCHLFRGWPERGDW